VLFAAVGFPAEALAHVTAPRCGAPTVAARFPLDERRLGPVHLSIEKSQRKETSMRISPAFVLASALGLGACGAAAPQSSALKDRYDVPTDGIDAEAVRAFVQHGHEIAAGGRGTLTIDELLAVVPLNDSDRTAVRNAYPNGFDVSCTDAKCSFSGTGRQIEAQLHGQVGPVSDPLLGLRTRTTGDFVVRGDDGLEFCNLNGIYVRKLFVTKNVQGMFLTGGDDIAINVNLAGSDNYTCQ
jgi:hypothetical protein